MELALLWPGFPPPTTTFLPIDYRLSKKPPAPRPRRTRPGSTSNPGLPRGQPGADKNVKRPGGPSRHALPSPVLTAAVPGGLGPHLGREDAARQNGHPTPPPLPPRMRGQPGPTSRRTRGGCAGRARQGVGPLRFCSGLLRRPRWPPGRRPAKPVARGLGANGEQPIAEVPNWAPRATFRVDIGRGVRYTAST